MKIGQWVPKALKSTLPAQQLIPGLRVTSSRAHPTRALLLIVFYDSKSGCINFLNICLFDCHTSLTITPAFAAFAFVVIVIPFVYHKSCPYQMYIP